VAAHDKEINAVAVAPNDALAATASQDRTIKLWTLPTLVAGLTLRGHKRGVWAVAFSPVDQVRGAAGTGGCSWGSLWW
jgi:U3 small nucleolar RNA-associated protein 13